MKIVASAPGKVVLLGEYAVLEGAPALSMAVDRRAIAVITPMPGAGCEVHAPDILLDHAAAFDVDADGAPRWADAADAADVAALGLVDQVLRALTPLPATARGFSLRLESSAFFDRAGAGKLGLGSSAALTVAMASALAVHSGDDRTADRSVWLERLLQIHRQFQAGAGSGVDIATSLIGGLIEYRLPESGVPQTRPARWPRALHYGFAWSGRSASTPRLLGLLQSWRERHTADYAARMADLTAMAEAGAVAVRDDDATSLLTAAAAYAAGLQQLGEVAGLGIFSAEHLRLAELARDSAVVYKPCGAGGGDVGVAFALDPQALQHFAVALAGQGFTRVPMSVDEDGLRLKIMETEEA